jgi:hypothetical protein
MEDLHLVARLDYVRGRLENAERIGRPAHIARCRQRYEGVAAKFAPPRTTEHTEGSE